MLNVIFVPPAAMGTFMIGLAAALSLDTFTKMPPFGALGSMVIVPLEVVPPVTGVGSMVNAVSATGEMVMGSLTVTPLKVAVMTTSVGSVTALVSMLKDPVFIPGLTSTFVTFAAALSLPRVTITPVAGLVGSGAVANPFIVTVAGAAWPPTTALPPESSASITGTSGTMVRAAVLSTLLSVPVTVTVTSSETTLIALIENKALSNPAPTVVSA